MFITLLTHATEIDKSSNTGQLALTLLKARHDIHCQRVIWQRKTPDAELLQRIDTLPSALLYPAPNEQPPLPLSEPLPEHIILLDSTWQQARKIYNHSAYLHGLGYIVLKPKTASLYQLRRNQLEGGLCTSECVAELLRIGQHSQLATQLDAELAVKQAR